MHRIIFFILGLYTSYGFSQVVYKGKVTNKNNEPVEFADVVLLSDKGIYKGTVTNDKGTFEIVAKEGTYTLRVSFLGYKDWSKKVNAVGTVEESITLLENSQELEAVQIEASKKVFKRTADRLVFDVKNSLIGKANGDMTELLSFTPGVFVNGETIQVFGKDGTLILINGRKTKLSGNSLTAFLKSLKATDIDRIEIIKNPPAKYDAEGNVALINIITKKKTIDFWNSNIGASYRQGHNALVSGTGSFNYNKKKFFFSTNVSYINGKWRGEERNKIFYPNNLWNQETNYTYETDLFTANLSSEYRINSKWLIGAQYVGSFNTPGNTSQGTIKVEQPSNSIAKINNTGVEEGERKLNGLNFHSVINITPKRVINIDFDYFDFEREQGSIINTIQTSGNSLSDVTRITNNSLQKISNFSSQVDVEYPIKNVALNFGGKVSFSETDNNVFITGGVGFDQETMFTYKEDIQALYASLSSSFGLTQWSFKSGLRMERTETLSKEHVLDTEVRNDYVNFFPTVYVTYRPGQHHNFSLDYSKRINRPGFSALNPFRIYTSPFSYAEGNPNLRPVLSSNVTFGYLYKNFFSAEIYTSQTENNSGQVAILDNDNLTQSITRLNYFDSFDVGLMLNYLYAKKTWWQSLATFQIYHSTSDSKIAPITPASVTGIGGIIKTTNHFVLDKKQKTLVGFDFTYRFPNTSKDIVYNFEQYLLNAFIKYNATNNLEVSLTVNNILREFNFNNRSTRNQTDAIYNGYYDTQYLKFSINYNFGNRKVRKTNRKMSNVDEKNRTN
ncbi:Outer membrane receptor proteins, mostly Fe transport [Tenacibaculum sp. 190130A14a]